MSIYNSFTIVGYIKQIDYSHNDATENYSDENYTGLSLETSCDQRTQTEESIYGNVHSMNFNVKQSNVENVKHGDLVMIKGHMVGMTPYSGDTSIAFNNVLVADEIHPMQSDLNQSKTYAIEHFKKAKNTKEFRGFDEEVFDKKFK